MPRRKAPTRKPWEGKLGEDGWIAHTAGVDIETTHLKGDFGHILVACVKPLGEDPIVLRLDEYWKPCAGCGRPERMWDDSRLVADLSFILEHCMHSFGWYSRKFDLKFLRTRKILHRQQPSRQFLHKDLWEFRARFLFHNNRLETWLFNFTEHKKTDLRPREWVMAAHGDKDAMQYVVDHCVADTVGMEELYRLLEPHIVRWSSEVV